MGSEQERAGFAEAGACGGKIPKSKGAQALAGPGASPSGGMALPGAKRGQW